MYGTLKGRAFAGLAGEEGARVFAYRFAPELVSIGDVFALGDDFPSLQNQPGEMWLQEGRLQYHSTHIDL